MSPVDQIAHLYATNELEVEDILALCHTASHSEAESLRAFALSLPEHEANEVPYREWFRAVCMFLERGYDGLLELGRSLQGLPFALGVLKELNSAAALRAAVSLADTHESADAVEAIFDTLNSLRALANEVDSSAVTKVRALLHAVVACGQASPHDGYAAAMYALRGFGDESTVALLKCAKDPVGPFEDARNLALREIRKRSGN